MTGQACHDRLGGSNSPLSLSPLGGSVTLLPRILKQGFHAPPTAALFSQATSTSFTPWEAPPPSPLCSHQCRILHLVHVIGPSGHLSCLAHMLWKMLTVGPTLLGRIRKAGLPCTNLLRDRARVTVAVVRRHRFAYVSATPIRSMTTTSAHARTQISR